MNIIASPPIAESGELRYRPERNGVRTFPVLPTIRSPMNPFTELTVDGRLMRGAEISAWADDLVERTRYAPWAIDLRTTCRALVDGEGALPRTSGTTGAPKAWNFLR